MGWIIAPNKNTYDFNRYVGSKAMFKKNTQDFNRHKFKGSQTLPLSILVFQWGIFNKKNNKRTLKFANLYNAHHLEETVIKK